MCPHLNDRGFCYYCGAILGVVGSQSPIKKAELSDISNDIRIMLNNDYPLLSVAELVIKSIAENGSGYTSYQEACLAELLSIIDKLQTDIFRSQKDAG